MIIRKIRMVNFRGFRDKTIDFNNKSVILLSAANGIGKTTTIDAIEWCLTGKIGRLKTAFNNRSTNEADRKQNTNGILKNRDSSNTSKVQVFLWIMDGEKEKVLCREQKKDELNPDVSKITIDGNEEAANIFVKQYVGRSFYNFHFCDVQKSFSVQSTKRGDLESLFSEFITNYDEQKQIAENIMIFADDVERYIEDKKKQKVPQEIITNQKTQLQRKQEEANQVPYPNTIFYDGENLEVINLGRDKLLEQKTKLKNCGYITAKNEIQKLINNDYLNKELSTIKEIIKIRTNKATSIREAGEVGLFNNSGGINTLEFDYQKLNKLKLTRDTILQDFEIVISYDNRIKKDFESLKQALKDKEEMVRSISSDIDLLANNNKFLKLLSTLSVNRELIVEYRNNILLEHGGVRCPVCGSDNFAIMDERLILKEADEYIRQNGEAVKVKENEKNNLLKEIENIYEKLIGEAKKIVEKQKEVVGEEIIKIRRLSDELKEYFEAVRRIQSSRKEISIENINNDSLENLQKVVESQILSQEEVKRATEVYRNILAVVGFDFSGATLQQLYEKLKYLISESCSVTYFSYDLFVSKINSIDSVLANHELADLRMKLQEENDKNKKIDGEIDRLQKLKNIAEQRAQKINEIVEKLSKDEYQKIGPTLSKFYNKLIRIGDNEGINIVHENGGISLIDDKGKNIVNTLSNGQISIFLLAYFFAGINVRNDREKMKIFFIDDLTACMDDVNMLAFIDLLKYQLSSKETMEQLFFVTCDSRISRLLKYKMNGHGIELRELVEDDFKQ